MCLLENAFAFVYIMVPTWENMLGITSLDDTIDTTRTATLKRGKTPHIVSNIATMKPTKKRLSITLTFERPDYLKSLAPPHHSPKFIATCL
jgi:hypothetical protein